MYHGGHSRGRSRMDRERDYEEYNLESPREMYPPERYPTMVQGPSSRSDGYSRAPSEDKYHIHHHVHHMAHHHHAGPVGGGGGGLPGPPGGSVSGTTSGGGGHHPSSSSHHRGPPPPPDHLHEPPDDYHSPHRASSRRALNAI